MTIGEARATGSFFTRKIWLDACSKPSEENWYKIVKHNGNWVWYEEDGNGNRAKFSDDFYLYGGDDKEYRDVDDWVLRENYHPLLDMPATPLAKGILEKEINELRTLL